MTFFESHADETLLRQVGLQSKELKGGHSQGRSKVCGKLSKSKESFGLIDEDPGSAHDPYLAALHKIKPAYQDTNIILIEDIKRGNKLAIIRPNLEGWVVKIAKDKKVDLDKNYALSMKQKVLHDFLTPKENLSERKKLNNFLKYVSDHKSIVKLKGFIKN